MPKVAPALLEILVCPAPDCRGPLEERADRLLCRRCGRGYRIEEHYPVLIPEEADPPPADWTPLAPRAVAATGGSEHAPTAERPPSATPDGVNTHAR